MAAAPAPMIMTIQQYNGKIQTLKVMINDFMNTYGQEAHKTEELESAAADIFELHNEIYVARLLYRGAEDYSNDWNRFIQFYSRLANAQGGRRRRSTRRRRNRRPSKSRRSKK